MQEGEKTRLQIKCVQGTRQKTSTCGGKRERNSTEKRVAGDRMGKERKSGCKKMTEQTKLEKDRKTER